MVGRGVALFGGLADPVGHVEGDALVLGVVGGERAFDALSRQIHTTSKRLITAVRTAKPLPLILFLDCRIDRKILMVTEEISLFRGAFRCCSYPGIVLLLLLLP